MTHKGLRWLGYGAALYCLLGCGEDSGDSDLPEVPGGTVPAPEHPVCESGSGTAEVTAPEVLVELTGDTGAGWLGSPAVADLDQDGTLEILAVHDTLTAWHPDGDVVWSFDGPGNAGRAWAGILVGDFRDDENLEVVVAAREQVWMVDAAGQVLSGWPVSWKDEIRSLAAGDIDGNGQLEVVVASTDNDVDILAAFGANGAMLDGFPPVEQGTIGCDMGENCWAAGTFDQNLAVGDLDGDGKDDIVAPTDNAYAGFYHGTGEAFDANPMFNERPKTPGVRYLHELSQAQQGWADDEESALQAHFTNTPPAIADIDEDGEADVIMLASVQNASQDDRFKGVALWVVHNDASRLSGWDPPLHISGYLSGLWDLEDNAVAATNQATVADLDPDRAGPEIVFAGFDGAIHAASADGELIWSQRYSESENVLTGGVVVGDLSDDGIPEIVFSSYSTEDDQSHLFILDAGGNQLHKVPLAQRGAMAVPTLADVNQDGTVEILLSMRKVGWEGTEPAILVLTVPGSSDGCLLWPTGRANLLRNGTIPPAE